LLFETERTDGHLCPLSIYVAFNFERGRNPFTRVFWWGFRLLFPAFAHDVLWNHSLCELKDCIEGR
jgi:hypothetical protein